MSVLKKNLEVSGTNNLSSYFPIRTSSSEGAFDWDVAQGIVVRNIYKKERSKEVTWYEKNERCAALLRSPLLLQESVSAEIRQKLEYR